MLLHEVAEPVNGCEIGMLVDRVLVVGNEQPKDVEVILFVWIERGAVEEAVDDRDGPRCSSSLRIGRGGNPRSNARYPAETRWRSVFTVMGSLLPIAAVVLRVSQDLSDVHAALRVYETGDEPVSVATNIENDQIADQIGRRKGSPNLVKAGKAVVVNEVVPFGEGISRLGLLGARSRNSLIARQEMIRLLSGTERLFAMPAFFFRTVDYLCLNAILKSRTRKDRSSTFGSGSASGQ